MKSKLVLVFGFGVAASLALIAASACDAGLFRRLNGAPRTPVRSAIKAVAHCGAHVVGVLAGCRRCSSAWQCSRAGSAEAGAPTPAVATCRTLPDGTVICDLPKPGPEPEPAGIAPDEGVGSALNRFRNAESNAGLFDRWTGHGEGRGPFRRLLSASAGNQQKVIDRFNRTVGAANGVVIDSITQLIEYVAENPDKILKIVQIIVSIIGMFG